MQTDTVDSVEFGFLQLTYEGDQRGYRLLAASKSLDPYPGCDPAVVYMPGHSQTVASQQPSARQMFAS